MSVNDMNLVYCTFEECCLLKEKGFEVPTDRFYTSDGGFHIYVEESEGESEYYFTADMLQTNWNQKGPVFTKKGHYCYGCPQDNKKYFEAFSAPTRAIALEWIRINFNLTIYPDTTVLELLKKI